MTMKIRYDGWEDDIPRKNVEELLYDYIDRLDTDLSKSTITDVYASNSGYDYVISATIDGVKFRFIRDQYTNEVKLVVNNITTRYMDY